MAMTTAAGTAAIDNAIAEELADFALKRASQTQLSTDEAFDVNVDLKDKIKARLLVDLDPAWSD